MLLALAVVLRVSSINLMSRKDVLTLQVLLPVAAIIVSANNPSPLVHGFFHGHYSVTPLETACVAAYLAYIYLFLQAYWMQLILAGGLALLTLTFGPSPAQMQTASLHLWNIAKQYAWKFAPKTTTDWGIASIGASFAFLAVGAGVSLRRQRPVMEGAE
jgi:hypothetical protein